MTASFDEMVITPRNTSIGQSSQKRIFTFLLNDIKCLNFRQNAENEDHR